MKKTEASDTYQSALCTEKVTNDEVLDWIKVEHYQFLLTAE